VVSCCECSDGPLGSGAMELVKLCQTTVQLGGVSGKTMVTKEYLKIYGRKTKLLQTSWLLR
jgi:hypothetical protein